MQLSDNRSEIIFKGFFQSGAADMPQLRFLGNADFTESYRKTLLRVSLCVPFAEFLGRIKQPKRSGKSGRKKWKIK